jgi:hypothetical protein
VYGLSEAKTIPGLIAELTGYHGSRYGMDDNKLVRIG